MASTTLFAPQVRAVQPAFVYDTDTTVIFQIDMDNTEVSLFSFIEDGDDVGKEFNFINWGDGTVTQSAADFFVAYDADNDGIAGEATEKPNYKGTHIYSKAGKYTCKISVKNNTFWSYAFYNNSYLTEIYFGADVTKIDRAAFLNCSKLKQLVIPNHITYIEGDAFKGNSALEFIYIGSSVETINNNAFDECVKLKCLYFNASNCCIQDPVYSSNKNVARSPFTKCGAESEGFTLIIGEDVEVINKKMFKAYLNEKDDNGTPGDSGHVYVYIKKIQILSSKLKTINEKAFYYFRSDLTELPIESVIDDEKVTIDGTAFQTSIQDFTYTWTEKTKTEIETDFNVNITSYGTVKVYFNLSSYNIPSDVNYILYTVIDPNKASTWGTNSVIKAAAAPVGYLWEPFDVNKKDSQSGEYYIEINFNNSDFKFLTRNQFYQVQLYFSNTNPCYYKKASGAYNDSIKYYSYDEDTKIYSEVESGVTADNFTNYYIYITVIDQEWLNTNKDNISVASQATLIRPISFAAINFTNLPDPKSGEDYPTVYDLSLLTGNIQYTDNSKVETIDTCWVEIWTDQQKIYTSENVKNQLGLNFEIPIKYNFTEDESYIFKLYYVTKNGYNFSPQENDFLTIKIKSYIPTTIPILAESKNNYVKIYSAMAGFSFYVDIKKRKTSSQDSFNTIASKVLIDDNSNFFYDYENENEESYEYGIIHGNSTRKILSSIQISFEDIFLSDENIMLAVRYNPNISGYKYVTQESITNTLGGKYPVIRKNGDTRYRQFNLSGTLFMNASEYKIDNEVDKGCSLSSIDMDGFFISEESSLYVKDDTIIKSYSTKERLERQARNIAEDFLTNGSVKLFRSPKEGNMIVYLSNVSFTPNKQLGRAVWDFSATVTEVCEYNMDNVNKYNLNDGREFKNALIKINFPTDNKSVTPLS